MPYTYVYTLHNITDCCIAYLTRCWSLPQVPGCRYPTLRLYDSLRALVGEWNVGIVYVDGCRRTVPMKVLEREFQGGIQQKGTAKLPWGEFKQRNAIMDRKAIIYQVLQAEEDGKEREACVAELEKKADQALQDASKKGGSKPSRMGVIAVMLQEDYQKLHPGKKLVPSQYERDNLKWNIPAATKQRAASRPKAAEAAE